MVGRNDAEEVPMGIQGVTVPARRRRQGLRLGLIRISARRVIADAQCEGEEEEKTG